MRPGNKRCSRRRACDSSARRGTSRPLKRTVLQGALPPRRDQRVAEARSGDGAPRDSLAASKNLRRVGGRRPSGGNPACRHGQERHPAGDGGQRDRIERGDTEQYRGQGARSRGGRGKTRDQSRRREPQPAPRDKAPQRVRARPPSVERIAISTRRCLASNDTVPNRPTRISASVTTPKAMEICTASRGRASSAASSSSIGVSVSIGIDGSMARIVSRMADNSVEGGRPVRIARLPGWKWNDCVAG